MDYNIWLIGASQGLLLSIFLLLKKDRKINLPITIFVLLTSIELLFQYIYEARIIFKIPHLLYLSEPFSMLSGVLIFMYVRNILSNHSKYKLTDILFFIPFVTYTFYYLPSYTQTSTDKIYDIVAFYNAGISWSENIYEWIAEILFTIPFLIASIILIKKHRAKIKNEYSNLAKINFTIVRNLLVAATILYSLEIATIFISMWNPATATNINTLIYVALVLIIYLTGFDAIVRKNTGLLGETSTTVEQNTSHTNVLNSPNNIANVEHGKYEKNALSPEKVKEIIDKIESCVKNIKPYKNPEIRLAEFAKLVHESPNNVSQIINDVFRKNFYEFINEQRVNEAKKLLNAEKYKNYTITAIGFEVGFNSKSTFYNAFKKFTGTTPTKFQVAAQNES